MNIFLVLLIGAVSIGCWDQSSGEAIAAVPTYTIDLAPWLITPQGPTQEPVQAEAEKVTAEVPFTCPARVPAPYADDTRAQHRTLIVVFKRHFLMGLYKDGTLLMIDGQKACYPIAMGHTPESRKISRDGMSTPEGWYHVASKRDIGQSTFYRAFHVSYPNREDVELARKMEVIDDRTHGRLTTAIRAGKIPAQETDMGGWIMIHGMGSEPRNWTLGCVALDNESIDVIFPYIKEKTPILILPWNS